MQAVMEKFVSAIDHLHCPKDEIPQLAPRRQIFCRNRPETILNLMQKIFGRSKLQRHMEDVDSGKSMIVNSMRTSGALTSRFCENRDTRLTECTIKVCLVKGLDSLGASLCRAMLLHHD